MGNERGRSESKIYGLWPCVYGLNCRGSHVASPLERFSHSPFWYNGRFLRATNPQTTNHGFSADSDAASPQQTQTDDDASGYPQRVAGRLNRTSPTKSHTGDENECRRSSQAADRRGPWNRIVGAVPKGGPALLIGELSAKLTERLPLN